MSDSSNSRTWEIKANEAKSKHRPKLKDWGRSQFAISNKFDRYVEFCELNNAVVTTSIPRPGNPENLTHLDSIRAEDLSVQDFIDNYEAREVPCIIRNIAAVEEWKAIDNWNFDNLKKTYEEGLFKVGEDDDGYKVKMPMKYFIQYLKKNKDDSPLYIFDSNYDASPINKSLLQDYKVPEYFNEDLFQYVGERRRPPYRWFLVGPRRSGTCVHIDPLATSAWNTVIEGRKRWVVFPPHVGKAVAKGLLRDCILKGEDDEATNYFMDILPRIRTKFPEFAANILEFTQYPGDTVYVPGGWWHSVINLDNTIAITQNYCSGRNFDAVWRQSRTGRKKMSVKWLERMEVAGEQIPVLKQHVQRAHELNRLDGFVMGQSSKKSKKDKKDKKSSSSSTCTTSSSSTTPPATVSVSPATVTQIPNNDSSKKSKKHKRSSDSMMSDSRSDSDSTVESTESSDNSSKSKKKKKGMM